MDLNKNNDQLYANLLMALNTPAIYNSMTPAELSMVVEAVKGYVTKSAEEIVSKKNTNDFNASKFIG